jgi:hypothetical protein
MKVVTCDRKKFYKIGPRSTILRDSNPVLATQSVALIPSSRCSASRYSDERHPGVTPYLIQPILQEYVIRRDVLASQISIFSSFERHASKTGVSVIKLISSSLTTVTQKARVFVPGEFN